MELDKHDVKELFKTLGSIEQKQIDMCAAVGQVQKRVQGLPCETRAMELGKRVTWRQLLAIISMALFIIFGAMGLHYDVTSTHAEDKQIHKEHKGE